MKLFISLLFLVLSNSANAQTRDYLKMRDTVCPGICGWRDSSDLVQIIPKMQGLNVATLSPNSRAEFFEDLANCEYQLFCRTGDKKMIRESAFHYSLTAHYDPKNYNAYWNAAFAFYLMSDFPQMECYLQLYELRTPKKFMDDYAIEKITRLRGEATKNLPSKQ